ncbi:MAG: AAA family ATPase [Actinomycetales bacterium]|nr:AAA family ATPase [Actinomycetales bacterium]
MRLVLETAAGPTAARPLPVFGWTLTGGLLRRDQAMGHAQKHNASPGDLLHWIREVNQPGVYVLQDFHPFLDDPVHVRLLKDIALDFERVPRTVVLVSHRLTVPGELSHLVARFELAFPSEAERREIVERVALEWQRSNGRPVQLDYHAVDLLVANLAGLTRADVERLARTAVFDDGAIDSSDVAAVTRAKHDLLGGDGAVTYEYETAELADLGGMERLKSWLAVRAPAFDGTAPHLQPPKGVLLLGVQGCGKSLASKVAASMLGVPLLRADLGAVRDKYVGESERKLRAALATADTLAPCVLWIDEIEKGVSADASDDGVSSRLLGTFLTWLQEKDSRVFVVATANSISALPPELVRKGRFDEIFFVDLPAAPVRAQILGIHTARRGLTLDAGTLDALAVRCDGFSGAEIEQAVVSATYAAHARGEELGAAHVAAELAATRPLSVVMAEPIAQLRAWAASRTVPAN